MRPTPRVSIITIFLDTESFLNEAIESVLAQSFDDWELLLVDDGSLDASTPVALRHAQQMPARIRYLEHPGHRNLGMSLSRNLGLEAAHGEYIAFLDADDVWLPGKLAAQVALLDQHPEAVALCAPAEYWYSWTGAPDDLDRDFVQRWSVPLDQVVAPPTLLDMYLGDEWASLCDLLVRREPARRLGGYEAAFSAMYEDQAFHAKLCLESPLYVASSAFYRYRQHPESCTSRSHARGATLPARLRFQQWLDDYRQRRGLETAAPGARAVDFGTLRRLEPASRQYGFDRGQPVDRHYIESFLRTNATDIRGRVLEIGDDSYTRAFGGDAVSRADVLHVDAANPKATFVDDLARGETLPSGAFDCIVLTQTLQLVWDLPAALRTLHRILAPGGVVLATVPGVTQLSSDLWRESWYWGFTTLSARRLFAEPFGPEQVEVAGWGNVLACLAFLEGLSSSELTTAELDHVDPLYQLLITVRAVKVASTP